MKYTVILKCTREDRELWEIDVPDETDAKQLAQAIRDDPYMVIRELEGDMTDSDPVHTHSLYFESMKTKEVDTMKKYTVTVIATHQIRESYEVYSSKPLEELEQDIKDDPWQVYCGPQIEPEGEDEFLGCTELIFESIQEA
jgi:hypothetical protein